MDTACGMAWAPHVSVRLGTPRNGTVFGINFLMGKILTEEKDSHGKWVRQIHVEILPKPSKPFNK